MGDDQSASEFIPHKVPYNNITYNRHTDIKWTQNHRSFGTAPTAQQLFHINTDTLRFLDQLSGLNHIHHILKCNL